MSDHVLEIFVLCVRLEPQFVLEGDGECIYLYSVSSSVGFPNNKPKQGILLRLCYHIQRVDLVDQVYFTKLPVSLVHMQPDDTRKGCAHSPKR
jgi:hypothetical protein